MRYDEYEDEGRVKISGEWYHVFWEDGVFWVGAEPTSSGRYWELESIVDFIEDYEPPKKEVVHEWLDKRDWIELNQSIEDSGNDEEYVVSKFLTERYGAPPIVRTYNGEGAQDFGIDPEYYVLYWNGREWEFLDFDTLGNGDKWMLQPPAPKED